jgi:hypothetical protein
VAKNSRLDGHLPLLNDCLKVWESASGFLTPDNTGVFLADVKFQAIGIDIAAVSGVLK